MKLNTAMLFQLLIKTLRPELACDVGSMDATHARRFRQILPNSRIVAFEANPRNARFMWENEDVKKDRIEVQHKAVLNRNGTLTFYVEHLSADGGEQWRRGISSVRRRVADSIGITEVEVESVRLDTFVCGLNSVPESVALWIDVEGAAFELLEGMRYVQDRVKLVHVEVETSEIWHGQKLKSDVVLLMKRMGFIELARGFPIGRNDIQHDLVFINARTFSESPFKFGSLIFFVFILTNLQRLAGKIFQSSRKALPHCAREVIGMTRKFPQIRRGQK